VRDPDLMDMQARSLFNIALTLERLGEFNKAIEHLQKSIIICKNHDLYELLTDCLTMKGEIHLNKLSDHQKAINCFNLALDNASRLENRVSLYFYNHRVDIGITFF
jgi:tetratricopeptide (TPR) repeat protein